MKMQVISLKKEDLRVKKTKESLYNGLLKLMEQKSFEEIRVTDICQITRINRSTFYDHFGDKYELLSSMIEDKKKELITQLKELNKEDNLKEYYLGLIRTIIKNAKENFSINSSFDIIKKNNNSIAFDMIFDATLQTVISNFKENYHNSSNVPIEVIARFYVSGVVSVLTETFKSSEYFDDEKIVEYIDAITPDLNFFTKIKNKD